MSLVFDCETATSLAPNALTNLLPGGKIIRGWNLPGGGGLQHQYYEYEEYILDAVARQWIKKFCIPKNKIQNVAGLEEAIESGKFTRELWQKWGEIVKEYSSKLR